MTAYSVGNKGILNLLIQMYSITLLIQMYNIALLIQMYNIALLIQMYNMALLIQMYNIAYDELPIYNNRIPRNTKDVK